MRRKRFWVRTLALTAALLAVAWWVSDVVSFWYPSVMGLGRLPTVVVLPKDGPPRFSANAVRPSPDPINVVLGNAKAFPIDIGSKQHCVIWLMFPRDWQAQTGYAGQLQLCEWPKSGYRLPQPGWVSGAPLILMNFTQAQFDALVGKPLPQNVIDALLNANANPPPANAVTVPWPP